MNDTSTQKLWYTIFPSVVAAIYRDRIRPPNPGRSHDIQLPPKDSPSRHTLQDKHVDKIKSNNPFFCSTLLKDSIRHFFRRHRRLLVTAVLHR